MKSSGRRVTALVAVVLLLTTFISVGAVLTSREMERLMETMVSTNLPGVEAATELQNALLQQRGLVAAYMLDDGRLAWVNDLDKIKPVLERRLAAAQRTATGEQQRKILVMLTDAYASYDQERERAIALYHEGRRDEGRRLLLGDVSFLADRAYDLCRQLVVENERSMRSAVADAHRQVGSLALALGAGVGLAILLSVGLVLLVFRRLLLPMRRLARDARAFSDGAAGVTAGRFADDLHELEFYSRALMSDMTRTRTDLKESQGRLVAAEKLAAVGRFAAAATHEIRSPLTSMKMWLYQLKQSVSGQPEAAHACAVLEGELSRLEDLATSFLQFSRPPSLKLGTHCVSEIVGRTLELARHRMEERDVRLVRAVESGMPPVRADAHQLRQVLLNLLTNAADATPRGGVVRVSESFEPGGNGHPEVVVRIGDEGPGIPDSVRERLFEPFVTTKPNGTGLGLAVASSIVAQHGGRIVLEDQEGPGAVFAVRLAACPS